MSCSWHISFYVFLGLYLYLQLHFVQLLIQKLINACLCLFTVIRTLIDNDILRLELSAELRVSLEEQMKATEKQLAAECERLRREVETIGEEKKDVEKKLESERKTLNEQLDRQRLSMDYIVVYRDTITPLETRD